MRLRHLTLALVWASLFILPASVLGGLWTVRLGPFELLDPLAALSLLAAGSLGTGALVATLPLVLSVMLLGRFFCGWLCPYRPLMAASHVVRAALERRGLRMGRRALGEKSAFVSLGAVLILSAGLGLPLASFVYPPALFLREASHLRLYGAFGVGALTLTLIFSYDVFVARSGFCQDLCPGGALFRLLARTSPVRLVRSPAKCTPCGACNLACPLGQAPMTDRVTSGCERCGRCAAACPTDALQFRLGRPLPILGAGEEE